jgi:hypothetical protein
MIDSDMKTVRVILGIVLGLVGGIVLGFCINILLLVVCMADRGSLNRPTKHTWVQSFTKGAAPVVVIVAPVTGCVLGIIWAIRRNWRDASV